MLNKKDFLKYASKLAFPIMIQNLIGTLVNIADTVMLGYVSQTAMSASSLANQYTFILFCLYRNMNLWYNVRKRKSRKEIKIKSNCYCNGEGAGVSR